MDERGAWFLRTLDRWNLHQGSCAVFKKDFYRVVVGYWCWTCSLPMMCNEKSYRSTLKRYETGRTLSDPF